MSVKLLLLTAFVECVLGLFRFITGRLESERRRLDAANAAWELCSYAWCPLLDNSKASDADKGVVIPPKVRNTHSGAK
jgi:hypothetical protein